MTTNCPFCDSNFEAYSKCKNCSLCSTCCSKENNGICDSEDEREYMNQLHKQYREQQEKERN